MTKKIRVNFDINRPDDYRPDVYRGCNPWTKNKIKDHRIKLIKQITFRKAKTKNPLNPLNPMIKKIRVNSDVYRPDVYRECNPWTKKQNKRSSD